MKKRLISLTLALMIISSNIIGAFASTGYKAEIDIPNEQEPSKTTPWIELQPSFQKEESSQPLVELQPALTENTNLEATLNLLATNGNFECVKDWDTKTVTITDLSTSFMHSNDVILEIPASLDGYKVTSFSTVVEQAYPINTSVEVSETRLANGGGAYLTEFYRGSSYGMKPATKKIIFPNTINSIDLRIPLYYKRVQAGYNSNQDNGPCTIPANIPTLIIPNTVKDIDINVFLFEYKYTQFRGQPNTYSLLSPISKYNKISCNIEYQGSEQQWRNLLDKNPNFKNKLYDCNVTYNIQSSPLQLQGTTTDNITSAVQGDTVEVTAANLNTFSHWNILGLEDTNIDITNPTISFTMPNNKVKITAVSKPAEFDVLVSGGISTKEKAPANELITIAATPPSNYEFSKWNISPIPSFAEGDLNTSTIKFEMPNSNISATAEFRPIKRDFEVISNNCTVNGNENKDVCTEGSNVTLVAAKKENAVFSEWKIITGVSSLPNTSTVNFTMPKNAVIVEPVYEYGITVNNGSTSPTKTNALKDEIVSIKANIQSNKEFVKWTSTPPVAFTDATNPQTSFIMVDEPVSIQAVFDTKSYSVSVKNATTNKPFAKVGDTVTISAVVPTDKEFVKWESSPSIAINGGEKNATFTMPNENITITAVLQNKKHSVKVIGGTTQTPTRKVGETVTITANDIKGQHFVKWKVDGTELKDNSSITTSFTMPNNDVVVTADFSYTINAKNCISDKPFSKPGKNITVLANLSETEKLVGWNIPTDVSVISETENKLVFEMPSKEITVSPKLKNKNHTVAIFNGTVTSNTSPSTNDIVKIKAIVPADKEFVKWTSIPNLTINGKEEATFNMPNENVTITAVLKDKPFKINTIDSSADKTLATKNTEIKIKANVPSNMEFVKWTSTPILPFADPTNPVSSFKMTNEDVTIVPTFKPKKYSIVIEDGLADYKKASVDTEITISANVPKGKKFISWNCSNKNVKLINPKEPICSFKMVEYDVVITPIFKDIDYSISVAGGKSNKDKALANEKIKLTAKVPNGMKFVKWTVCGNQAIEIENCFDEETTFTMPYNDVAITAEFEFKKHGTIVTPSDDRNKNKYNDIIKLPANKGEFIYYEDEHGNLTVADKTYDKASDSYIIDNKKGFKIIQSIFALLGTEHKNKLVSTGALQ